MKAGFGRGRRRLAGTQVLASVLVAFAVWALANYVFTRPRLRTSFDLSPGSQFTISEETRRLIEALRDSGRKLSIDTFLAFNYEAEIDQRLRVDPGADPHLYGIVRKLLNLTTTLLERVDYLGGDSVDIERHDINREVDAMRGKGPVRINSVVLTVGKRKRTLMLVDEYFRSDFGDIELPMEGAQPTPGQRAVPVLRRYKGEEALASALAQLLEEESLKVYWATDRNAARPDDAIYQDFARDLLGDGFVHGLIDLDEAPAEPVPADCAVLFLIRSASELGEAAQRKLIDYLERGGRVLLGMDYEIDDARQGLPQIQHRAMLDRYGLRVEPDMVLNGIPDPSGAGGFRFGEPACMRLLIRRGLNATHPVTRSLAANGRFVDLLRARPIRFLEPRPTECFADFLLTSNQQSWLERLGPRRLDFGFRPDDPGAQRSYPVAATVSLAGEPPRGNGRLAVVAGLCFVNSADGLDGFYLSNRDFALSLVNWLVRRDRLVTIKSKDYRAGRIQAAPQSMDRIFWGLLVALPALFLVMAFGTMFWRRRA